MFKFEGKGNTQCIYHYSIAIVIALLLVSETRGQDDSTQLKLLNLYEEALVNNNLSLYTLRQTYFNPLPYVYSSSFCLQVSVTVKDILNPYACYVPDDYAFHYDTDDSRYYFDSYCILKLIHDDGGTLKLSDLLSVSLSADMFYLFDSTFYSIMQALSKSIEKMDYDNVEYYTENPYYINIDISGELEHMPCGDNAAYALRMLLVWAKSYARAGGIPSVRQEEDRIFVKACYDISKTIPGCPGNLDIGPIDPTWAWVLFVGILGSSCILVLSLVSLSIHKVFLWLQEQGGQTKVIYKASTIVLTVVNVITFGLDLNFYVKNDDWISVAFWGLPCKVILLLFIELPVVLCNTYELDQNGKKKYRFLHALALWQIICFIHHLVVDAIISAAFFILAPAQTVGVITLLLSVIASAIAFVAIIINRGCACDGKTCRFMFCAVFNGILITGLLLMITLLFIVMVDNGLQSAGVGGLILSLIPPLAVFVIGICVNKKHVRSALISTFLGGGENTSTNGSVNAEVDNGERQPLLAPRPGH